VRGSTGDETLTVFTDRVQSRLDLALRQVACQQHEDLPLTARGSLRRSTPGLTIMW